MAMDFSLLNSVPRLLAFYAVLLCVFYPAMALLDRLIYGKRGAKKVA